MGRQCKYIYDEEGVFYKASTKITLNYIIFYDCNNHLNFERTYLYSCLLYRIQS